MSEVQKLLISKIVTEMGIDESNIMDKIHQPIMTIGLSSVVILELIQETIDELKIEREATGLFSPGTKPEDITIVSVSSKLLLSLPLTCTGSL